MNASLNASMNASLKRLKYIVLFGNMHSARFTLAMAETIWAITLLWPGDTFDRPTYALMSLIAGENAWGLAFLATAFTQWWVLLSGKYHDRFAVCFASWNSMLWWFICISMYMSIYPPPAAISGELALSIAATWVFVRSGITKPGRRFDD